MDILGAELVHLSYKYPLALAVADLLAEVTFLVIFEFGTVPRGKNEPLDV